MTSRVTPFTHIPMLAGDWLAISTGVKVLCIFVDVENKIMDVWRLLDEVPADGTEIEINVNGLRPATYTTLGTAETTIQSNMGGAAATMVYIREA